MKNTTHEWEYKVGIITSIATLCDFVKMSNVLQNLIKTNGGI